MIKDIARIMVKSVWQPRLNRCDRPDLPELNILGTGPSMNNSIGFLQKNKDAHIMVLNDFAISRYFTELKPRYYMLIDPVYWKINTHEEGETERNRLYDCLINNIEWKMDIFIPSEGYKMGYVKERLKSNHNITVRPVNTYNVKVRVSRLYFFLLDHNLTTPSQNVLATSLVTALLLGYKNIGLHGAEHSWTEFMRVDDNNTLCTINKHFYDEPEILKPWIGTNGKPMEIANILFYLSETFRSYRVIAKYAESKHAKIINYTPGSYIDAFQRQNLRW